jgi:glycosyltransferase involved in cell wall biosynthesis
MFPDKKTTVIFILPNFFLSKQEINVDKYKMFSEKMNVQVFQKIKNPELLGFRVGDFRIVGCLQKEAVAERKFISHLFFLLFSIMKAFALRLRKEKVDHIICYDPLSSGIIGWIVSKITGASLIIEVNGNYGARKCWGADQSGNILGKLKFQYCQLIVPALLSRSDGVKLLYNGQLNEFKTTIKNTNIKVFHSFVPIKKMTVTNINEHYILLIGKPWHVKGVDLLIKAYNELNDVHDGTLKIVGYFSPKDLKYLKNLCGGNKKISIEPAVFYEEAQDLIDRCEFLVLPSRTEAMGRVLIEAMAHRKAVIGSSADGIPYYVQHMKNGLVFETEDWKGLEKAIRRLIKNPDLKQSLANQGYSQAHSLYSEESFLEQYFELLAGASKK